MGIDNDPGNTLAHKPLVWGQTATAHLKQLQADCVSFLGETTDDLLREDHAQRLLQTHQRTTTADGRGYIEKHSTADLIKFEIFAPTAFLLGSTKGQFLILTSVAILLILLCTIFWVLLGGSTVTGADDSWWQAAWISWGLFFDPGTQTAIPANESLKVKLVGVAFSVAGFLWNLTVLGTIAHYIVESLEHWKRFYGRTICQDHTLILGWGERTLNLLVELLAAYELDRASLPWYSRCLTPRRPIILLSQVDEVHMKQDVKMYFEQEPGLKVSSLQKIHYRKGDPFEWEEYLKASAFNAKDIIVMGNSRDIEASDHSVMRAVMALARAEEFKHLRGDVWAEVRDPENIGSVSHFLPASKGVILRPAILRALALLGVRPIVGACYQEMYSFKNGSQLYIRKVDSRLIGVTFAEACISFPRALVLGLHVDIKECAEHSTSTWLHGERLSTAHSYVPDPKYILKKADHLLMLCVSRNDASVVEKRPLSSDTDKIQKIRFSLSEFSKRTLAHTDANHKPHLVSGLQKPLIVAVAGCPDDLGEFLCILHLYLVPGSEVHILSKHSLEWRNNSIQGEHKEIPQFNFEVFHYVGDPCHAFQLNRLPIAEADCIFILSEHRGKEEEDQVADTRTLDALITMHYARLDKLDGSMPNKECNVVCELLSTETARIARDGKELKDIASYLCSNLMETALFAMATEDSGVFNALMSLQLPGNGAGDLIRVPVERYMIKEAEQLSFYDLHENVMQAVGGLLVGWRRGSERGGFEDPVLNPANKQNKYEWRRGRDELLIVINEEVATEQLQAKFDHRETEAEDSTCLWNEPMHTVSPTYVEVEEDDEDKEEKSLAIHSIWWLLKEEFKEPRAFIWGKTKGQWTLLILTMVIMNVLCTSAWMLVGGSVRSGADDTLEQARWISYGLLMDPGTQTGIPADERGAVKAVAILFSVMGFIWSIAVFGIIVSQIRLQLGHWKDLHSRIILQNHTVILGWGERTLTMLRELIAAYDSRHFDKPWYVRLFTNRRAIVVIANQDEIEMETSVAMHLSHEAGISSHNIYYRKGDIYDWRELLKVSAPKAACIILMGTHRDDEVCDQKVMRGALSLAAVQARTNLTGELWAELRDPENAGCVSHFLPICDGVVLRTPALRILVLCGLRPIIGMCYRELCTFQIGNQLYVDKVPPTLVGHTFAEACLCFPHAVVLGVLAGSRSSSAAHIDNSLSGKAATTEYKGDHDPSRSVVPHPDRRLDEDDCLMLMAKSSQLTDIVVKDPLSAQRSSFQVRACHQRFMNQDDRPSRLEHVEGREIVVILGAPNHYVDILMLLNLYVLPGAEVHILSVRSVASREEALHLRTFQISDFSFKLFHYVGHPGSHKVLSNLPLSEAKCIFILSECRSPHESARGIDSRSLDILVTQHETRKKLSQEIKPKVVCELLDVDSYRVAQLGKELKGKALFLCPNAMESALFAMATENMFVFNALMSLQLPGSGAGDLLQVPVGAFISGEIEELSFYELHQNVMQAIGGVMIGWRQPHKAPVLNPPDKAAKYELKRGREELLVVVLEHSHMSAQRLHRATHHLE